MALYLEDRGGRGHGKALNKHFWWPTLEPLLDRGDIQNAEPAISDDLITKHYISLNTFFLDKLCLRLCFKLNIYFLLKHVFIL